MQENALPATMGGRLKWLRKKKGESQAEVGRAVGCSGQQIGRYELDKDHPGGLILLKLSQHFGVSTAFIQCMTDDPHRNSNLPPEWEELVKRFMIDGWTPDDVERAVAMFKIYKSAEKRED